MEVTPFLQQNRQTILGRWFELIIRTYPRVTSEFLAKQKDQFRNPVGHTITQSIAAIYDQVVSAMDTEELLRALDGIIRIRSLQDFTPSETVAFIFQLKTVLRDVVDGQLREPKDWHVLADLESRIDRVALLAFEKYMECRQTLHRLRNNELETGMMKPIEARHLRAAVSRPKQGSIHEDV
jgi:hypothetical protein